MNLNIHTKLVKHRAGLSSKTVVRRNNCQPARPLVQRQMDSVIFARCIRNGLSRATRRLAATRLLIQTNQSRLKGKCTDAADNGKYNYRNKNTASFCEFEFTHDFYSLLFDLFIRSRLCACSFCDRIQVCLDFIISSLGVCFCLHAFAA